MIVGVGDYQIPVGIKGNPRGTRQATRRGLRWTLITVVSAITDDRADHAGRGLDATDPPVERISDVQRAIRAYREAAGTGKGGFGCRHAVSIISSRPGAGDGGD